MTFKKGDRVFDIHYGWGLVVDNDGSEFAVHVVFSRTSEWYTDDGRLDRDDPPTLSFTEYTLEGFSQERPEELPEKGQLVYVRCSNGLWKMRYFSHKEGDLYYCFVTQYKEGATTAWRELSIKNPLE